METDDSEYQDLRPVRVTWSHGDVLPEKAYHLTCEILSDIRNPSRIKRVVVADDNKKIYCGKLDQSPLSNNFIAIRNRKTNNVRWYPIDNFLMFPYRSELEAEPKAGSKVETVTDREAMLNLNKAMGSKKIKRRVMEAEKVNISVDNVEKKLKTAIKENDLVIDTSVEILPTQSEANYLPPCDRSAGSVEEVYKVYDLISPVIMNNLEEIATEVMKTDLPKLLEDTRLTIFFSQALTRVTKPDPAKVKLLLFADSLIKFLKEPIKVVRLKNPIVCNYSTSLNEKLLNEFCTVGLLGVRARPPTMRDKAICYVLVCLLLACNFSVDISVLSGSLTPQEYQKLPTLMRAIGATKDRNSQTTFHLKLPLAELPVSMRSRKSGSFGKKR